MLTTIFCFTFHVTAYDVGKHNSKGAVSDPLENIVLLAAIHRKDYSERRFDCSALCCSYHKTWFITKIA